VLQKTHSLEGVSTKNFITTMDQTCKYSGHAMGWKTEKSRFKVWKDQEFSLLYSGKNDSGVHPTCHLIGHWWHFPEGGVGGGVVK
jgi:hypothetical protein